VQVAQDDLPI
jgi:hypothetical protein